MITYIYGNVIEVKAEILVNASNGKGWMGGLLGRLIPLNGVAESIHYIDCTIERLAKKEARKRRVKCGDVFLTNAGKLNFSQGILHAVTMKRPGQLSNLSIIELCINNILTFCDENKIKTVAIPILGSGVGRVNTNEVLKLYEEKLSSSTVLFNVVIL